MTFSELGLVDPFLKRLREKGYTAPTPVQEKAIPLILQKKDVVVCAKTGSGKSIAFLLPILDLIHRENKKDQPTRIKALVLAPTRELAIQISEEANYFLKDISLKSIPIYGGVPLDKQKDKFKQGCDLLIATPGRLLDFLSSKIISLDSIRYVVLDEADRMLDMGFIDDVKHILKQVGEIEMISLWSATLDYNVFYAIWKFMKDPEEVLINPELIDKNSISQAVYHFGSDEKLGYVSEFCRLSKASSIIIFVNTKDMVERLTNFLLRHGIKAQGLSSVVNQKSRINILEQYKKKQFKVLVATDLASRGIHVDDIEIVINYDIPKDPEGYVHRIGRTARAEKKGESFSICCERDYDSLEKLENYLGYKIPIKQPDPEILQTMPILHVNKRYAQDKTYNNKKTFDNKRSRPKLNGGYSRRSDKTKGRYYENNELDIPMKTTKDLKSHKKKNNFRRNEAVQISDDYPALNESILKSNLIMTSNRSLNKKIKGILKKLFKK